MQGLKHQTLANIADICAHKNVQHVIISPGSRSAPLTMAFARHPKLHSRAVMDERAAGFIALGLAQQTRKPVALVCTSGTAALNYGPAVAEAFYQRIPLLIFTADRPPEWIDQQDGQTIRQINLYGPHVRGSFQLPVEDPHPDAQWHAERIISEAINYALWPLPGPVHINVPLREPLYPPPGERFKGLPDKIIRSTAVQNALSTETWRELQSAWQAADKKLIVAGMQPPQPALLKALHQLQRDPAVAVIGDLTANIHLPEEQNGGRQYPKKKGRLSALGARIYHWEMVLGTKSAETLKSLAPDLLITFGGPVVSKRLKLFLRKHKPQEHWRIDSAGQPVDTYQSLTRVIPTDAAYFFETLSRSSRVRDPSASLRTGPAIVADRDAGRGPAKSKNATLAEQNYFNLWLELEANAQKTLTSFLTDAIFGEFRAASQVLQALPEGSRLQLGNSMPIRYANFIGLAERKIHVNSNRGTSGIDGSLSTAVGAAMATDQLTALITGDLAFFYERNALWHKHLPPNLRIILLNNGGGGIFKLIDGPTTLPEAELEEYFFTPHPLTAKNTADDHNLSYFHCAAAEALQHMLPDFLAPANKAAILEIATDSAVNTKVFRQFKALLTKPATED